MRILGQDCCVVVLAQTPNLEEGGGGSVGVVIFLCTDESQELEGLLVLAIYITSMVAGIEVQTL